MPKSIRKVKDGNVWRREIVATKFRIGTRKHGKSANLMSDTELEAVLADSNKSKWHNSARNVLTNRNA